MGVISKHSRLSQHSMSGSQTLWKEVLYSKVCAFSCTLQWQGWLLPLNGKVKPLLPLSSWPVCPCAVSGRCDSLRSVLGPWKDRKWAEAGHRQQPWLWCTTDFFVAWKALWFHTVAGFVWVICVLTWKHDVRTWDGEKQEQLNPLLILPRKSTVKPTVLSLPVWFYHDNFFLYYRNCYRPAVGIISAEETM